MSVGLHLDGPSLLAAEGTCKAIFKALREANRALWRSAVYNVLDSVDTLGEAIPWRLLYQHLHGALDAHGGETQPCNNEAGNTRGWWRCHAIAVRGAGPDLEVRVRFVGCAESDDEWRSVCSLVPSRRCVCARCLSPCARVGACEFGSGKQALWT